MKKKFLSVFLLPTLLLASCYLTNNNSKEINNIYNDQFNEEVNYNKGILSSFAAYNQANDSIFSGTIIEFTNNKYYGISSSDLGNLNDVVTIYNNDSTFKANLIGLDSKNKLSILEITAESNMFSIPTITYDYQKGETLYTVSTPIFRNKNELPLNSVSKGILSRVDSLYIATDASLNSSSYGGGFYNKDGSLLAIFTSKIDTNKTEEEYVQGMSSGLMMKYVMKSYNQMKQNGNVKRALLGITVTDYHKSVIELQAKMYPNEIYGKIKVPDLDRVYCVVLNVDEKMNNVDGKIIAGDLILECNGEEVIHNSDISKVISFAQIGDKVTVKIKRYNSQTNEFDDLTEVITLAK